MAAIPYERDQCAAVALDARAEWNLHGDDREYILGPGLTS